MQVFQFFQLLTKFLNKSWSSEIARNLKTSKLSLSIKPIERFSTYFCTIIEKTRMLADF